VTEELQLFGETDDNKFNWIAGFYHELDHPGGYSEIQQDEFGGAGYFPPFSTTDVESLFNGGTSDAVYGSATYNASDWLPGLSFTAGGRYTWDHKVATADRLQPAGGRNVLPLSAAECGRLRATEPEREFPCADLEPFGSGSGQRRHDGLCHLSARL
jgi:outer membrane receptor protein involved in Fe transport